MNETPTLPRLVFGAAVRVAIIAAILVLSSGRWDWGMGWAVVALIAGAIAANLSYMTRRDPALLAERSRIHPDTKAWDKVLAPLVAVVLPLGLFIVAGLDARFGWSPTVPAAAQIAAWAVGAAAYVFALWALASNPFFASTVRIQTERGHRVVTGGPYRLVRHPGYSGAIVGVAALGSLWALVPALVNVAALVGRAALEDRTLRREPAGYDDYCHETRFRLFPGLW